MEEIINRVAQSSLQIIDLEDAFPNKVQSIDVAQWLLEGFFLQEKPFREVLKTHHWQQYQDAVLAIHCNTDALLPAWAFALVAAHAAPHALLIVQGTPEAALNAYYQQYIGALDLSNYQDKPVLMKGCSKKSVPQQAYVQLIQRLVGIAKSVQFGEACSAVPLYKAPKP